MDVPGSSVDGFRLGPPLALAEAELAHFRFSLRGLPPHPRSASPRTTVKESGLGFACRRVSHQRVTRGQRGGPASPRPWPLPRDVALSLPRYLFISICGLTHCRLPAGVGSARPTSTMPSTPHAASAPPPDGYNPYAPSPTYGRGLLVGQLDPKLRASAIVCTQPEPWALVEASFPAAPGMTAHLLLSTVARQRAPLRVSEKKPRGSGCRVPPVPHRVGHRRVRAAV